MITANPNDYMLLSLNPSAPAREMPRYKCHKTVWALKIARVKKMDSPKEGAPPQWILEFDQTDYAPIEVEAAYVQKHNPESGGYYVVYEDGYKSYSPAQSFENGYEIETLEVNLEAPERGSTIQLQKRNRQTGSISYQTIKKVEKSFDVDAAIKKYFGPLEPQLYEYRWVTASDPNFRRPEPIAADAGM